MWCFVPSAFFGLDFRLDQSRQGTRGSFFCSEMSLGELNLSHVALASAWVLVRYHADGWGGILPLTLDRSELLILVAEPCSNLGLGRDWIISEKGFENFVGYSPRLMRAHQAKGIRS